jgi:FHA domain-containing protein/regulatory LuxR family protein
MGGVSANPPADARSAEGLDARIEAERAGRPYLLYTDGDAEQQLFLFVADSEQATVGRSPPVDLLLDWDDQVSRLHARFELVAGHWELIDDGLSSNGTFVNGERLSGRRRLNHGDSVRFGATMMTFGSPQPEQAPADPPPEAPDSVSLSTSQRRVLVALCRPYSGRSGFASPASDQQIADELFLSAGAVRTHVRVLFAKLGVEESPAGDARVRLVERAFASGLISERDL